MNQNVQPHSGAWVTFTYVSFSASAFMVAVGVFFLPLDLWIKAISSSVHDLPPACTWVTVRDMHESGKPVNRIEDARRAVADGTPKAAHLKAAWFPRPRNL